MTSQSQVERPDLDALFADLAHPNPHLQTQAYLAMVDHWPNESMPRLISLLDQPDVSCVALLCAGSEPLVRQHCNPLRSCLKTARMARCAPAA